MKKMMLGTAALAIFGAASPGAAQYVPYPDDRQRIDDVLERRLDEIRFRIDDGERRGRVGPEEAASLRDELIHLRRVEALYARRGFSSWERGDLQRRLVLLGDRLRYIETYGRGDQIRGYDDRPDGPPAGIWDERAGPGADAAPPYEGDESWSDGPSEDPVWEESEPQSDELPWQDDDDLDPGEPDDGDPDDPNVGDAEDEGFDDGDWEPI